MLTLLTGSRGYAVHTNASKLDLRCVLKHNSKVIAYGLKKLKNYEHNYPNHDLEFPANVFALELWRHYLYQENLRFSHSIRVLNTSLTIKNYICTNKIGWIS